MTRRFQLLPVLAAALLGAASLTACAPSGGATPTPTAAATATPTPTVTAATEEVPLAAARIDISGTEVVVSAADGTAMVAIPFSTEPTTAVAQLSEALGVEPTTSTRAANICQPETVVYTWGQFDLHVPGYVTKDPGAVFTVQANGPTTVEGVPIRSAGIAVGSTIAEVSAVPGVYTFDDSFGGVTAQLDRISGTGPDDPNATGALAYLSAGIVTDLISPVYYYGDC